MVDEASADPSTGPTIRLAAHTERALAALLSIAATDAAMVRDRSPARRRPHGQHGPLLDLGTPGEGTDDGSGAVADPGAG